MSYFLARQIFKSFLKYIYYITHAIYIFVCMETFLLCLIKAWERTATKRRDGSTGKHGLNEMGEYEIENMK